MLLCNAFAYTQVERVPAQSQPFNEDTWRKAVASMNNYQNDEARKTNEAEQKRMNIKDKYKETPPPAKPIEPPTIRPGNIAWAGFLKVLLIVLGIVLIAGMIYYFMGGMSVKDRKISVEELEHDLTHIEENLPIADVETPLEKAIRMGEYKVAFRMYFLLILQLLANKGIIKWRKDKTNREYVRELRQQTYLPQFMSAVLMYEKAWFGLGGVSKEEFEQGRIVFENLKSKI
jgi:hypothetical protein